MSWWRTTLTVLALLVLAMVLQSSVFGRLNVAGIAPDLVTLVVVLLPLRLSAEATLAVAFVAGLVQDARGAGALGLRAFVLTVVAYVAIRTRERADYSPLAAAVWVGLLTLVGSALLVVVGRLVSQLPLSGGEAMRRILLVPLLTFLVALVFWPVLGRLIEPRARRGL